MRNDFGGEVPVPETVPATMAFLHHVADRFEVMNDFHPAFDGSITLVDRESGSAITVVIVESAQPDLSEDGSSRD